MDKKTPDKRWHLKSKEGKVFSFLPEFIVDEKDNRIETRYVRIKIDDKEYTFNFLDLFMFIYFCANEEIRRSLAMRYERKVNYIPYEVSFKLSKEESDRGVAKRRIELPVEELTMAIARNESLKVKTLANRAKSILGIK